MGNEIYGLNYDFIHQQGVFLTFTKHQGIHSNEMIQLHVKMLQANSVPQLLPIKIEEIDFQVKLQYNISSKKLLQHTLKGRKITQDEFCRILYKIVSILEDSKIYMLSEANYILNEDFIYSSLRDVTDIYLTYLPLQNLDKNETVKGDLRNLTMYLIGQVDKLHGEVFQRITLYFKEEPFSLTEFKRELKIMIEQRRSQNPVHIPEVKKSHALNEAQIKRSSVDRVEEKESAPRKQSNKKQDNLNSNQPDTSMSSRTRTFVLLGALLFLAILWQFYLFFGSEGVLFISLGLSLIVIDAVYILFTIWRPSKVESKNKEEPKVQQIDIEPKVPTIIDSHAYYENLPNQTTLLKETDNTELIEQDKEQTNSEKSGRAYLEVQRADRLEKIRIKGNRFVIGRNPSTVHYVEDVRGVSRAHVEVIVESNQYKLVDLGSSNGTYLNQHQLVPNKEYIVEDGDSIKISQTEFLFKLG
jgi:hypothetical protein